jgi:DNA-binding NtrC family response regulator
MASSAPHGELAGRRILIVDDEDSIRFGLSRFLTQKGAQLMEAASAAEALTAIEREQPEIVLLDLKLPDGDGVAVLERIVAMRPDARVVMMTGYGTIEGAVAAIRSGAEDFLTKPVDLDHLLHVLRRIVDMKRLASQNLLVQRQFERFTAEQFWGDSEGVRKLLEEAQSVAQSDALAVLTGESGTGKGVLARQIHQWSRRRPAPFVNVNCAGLNRELLESELFGHERGAFTGATQAKPGLFELADRGTLFLDEVAEIDLTLQPRLLKAVEEQKFHRVGGTVERSVDVRVIAATNRDLKEEVRAGRFRSDLYYRLNVLELRLPPLRDRRQDVVPLAVRFLEEFDTRAGRGEHRLEGRGARLLASYSWPGNVRELRNLMERISVLAPAGILSESLLARYLGMTLDMRQGELPTLEEKEKEYIAEVLRLTVGNKSAAAELLGITRNTLYAKIRAYGLSEEAAPEGA